MEHTLSTQVHDARIELSMGLYTIRFADEAVLDVNQMKRVEAARRQLVEGGVGPVLVLIPRNAALVEQEALAWLGSEEAMLDVPARSCGAFVHSGFARPHSVGVVQASGSVSGVSQSPSGERLGARPVVRFPDRQEIDAFESEGLI